MYLVWIVVYLYFKITKVLKDKPHILITNDDGVHAAGIAALAEAARKHGRVTVMAPDGPQSGMSHAITVADPIRINSIRKEEGFEVYSCSGTPVDCIKLALNQLLDEKPDLILSGVNHGSNASVSVFYSGTMAGAIEGCINKIPSIGFSITDYSENANFQPSKPYLSNIIKNVLDNGLEEGICLNVNIPAIDGSAIKGVRICRQTNGLWQEEFVKRVDPFGKDYFWLTGFFKNFESDADDTDEWALQHNYLSIVPIKIDMTAYQIFDALNKWNYEDLD